MKTLKKKHLINEFPLTDIYFEVRNCTNAKWNGVWQVGQHNLTKKYSIKNCVINIDGLIDFMIHKHRILLILINAHKKVLIVCDCKLKTPVLTAGALTFAACTWEILED